MSKYAYLVMVTADNNNKYYEMKELGSTLDVTYGRIKSTAQKASYGIGMWQTKYNEKIKKGYQDMTHTKRVEEVVVKNEPLKLAKIEDSKVEAFIQLMQQYTKGLVSKTYTVKAQDVTVAQVNEAQDHINKLVTIDQKDVTLFNTYLLKLYMVIPRYMGNVKDYLLPSLKNVSNVLQQEQDNLDAMSAQVQITKKEVAPKEKKDKVKEQTLLDLLGINKMKEVNSSKEIDYLVKQITGKKVQAIFEIDKPSEEQRFNTWLAMQENKKTKFVYHGTKCTSVIPILEQGLKIRPTGNFQFSGKVYGNGNYFSEQFNTSIGYTDGGRNNDNVMLIYEVHTGRESKNSFHDYNSCKKAGYDSFEGGWLRVAYREEQSKIKYAIWLK